MKFDIALIDKILYNEDPEGLIKIGAPKDEYSYIAFMIHNRITNEKIRKDVDSIFIKVVGVFLESFGSSSTLLSDNAFGFPKFDEAYVSRMYKFNTDQRYKKIAQLIFESGT